MQHDTLTGRHEPTASPDGVTIRPVEPADHPAIHEIYAHHVLHGLASFEEEPPSITEMAARIGEITGSDYPFLVAECDGAVRGYAHVSQFRERSAYRFTVEDSVYIAPGYEGQGLGRVLLARLIERCRAAGLRQMVAVIGGGSPASVRLHASLGFQPVGRLPAVGHKFGEWRDLVIMQRAISGDRALPPESEVTE